MKDQSSWCQPLNLVACVQGWPDLRIYFPFQLEIFLPGKGWDVLPWDGRNNAKQKRLETLQRARRAESKTVSGSSRMGWDRMRILWPSGLHTEWTRAGFCRTILERGVTVLSWQCLSLCGYACIVRGGVTSSTCSKRLIIAGGIPDRHTLPL